jgi:CO/xanthine dehydrogenase FAD-binding subunit
LYLRPTNLKDALDGLAETRGIVLSGGTDVFPAVGDRPLTGPVVDISDLPELKGIRQGEQFTELGGRTTWSEIVAANLPRGFDGLKAAAREVGGVQIQNQGTIAGNICNASPAADGVAALLALDAQVALASRKASRTMSLSEFILGNRKTARHPDEILTSILIPRRLHDSISAFLKLGTRRYLVISIVMVAINLRTARDGRIEEALVCVGSCSAKAMRMRSLENVLAGRKLQENLHQLVAFEHFEELAPIDDIRATAEYRRGVAKTLVERALTQCIERAA